MFGVNKINLYHEVLALGAGDVGRSLKKSRSLSHNLKVVCSVSVAGTGHHE